MSHDMQGDPDYGYTAHLAGVAFDDARSRLTGALKALPCNVCLWEEDGGTVVSIAKPAAMFEIVKSAALQPLVGEVDQRLRRAIDEIGATLGKSEMR